MRDPSTQYATSANLAARQRFWAVVDRQPRFELYDWVLGVAGLDAGSGDDVLDVGCGNGRYETLLSARGHRGRVVALDLSPGMLAEVVAPARVLADAEHLPVAASTFDVVLAPHMLYHVDDIGRAARECRRALRPGGRFVAVTNGTNNIHPYTELVERAVGTGWRMDRPSSERFSLDNGAALLAPAFRSVTCVAAPSGEVVVTDLDALTDYIASVGDTYGPSSGQPWDAVVRRARDLAAAEMDRSGALRWPTEVGAFVCT